jgi:O-antigen ligase
VEAVVVKRGAAVSPVALAAGVLVWLACMPVQLADLTPNAPHQYDFHALLFPTDLAIIAVVLVAARQRRLPRLAAVAAVVLATLAFAFVFHPSLRGATTLLRWTGVVALATLVERRIVIALTGGFAVVQSVIAIAQKLAGGTIGLGALGESHFSFVKVGSALATSGTLIHPYLLAGLSLFGAAVLAAAARAYPDRRRELLAAAAVAVAPVGFTYSRAAIVGLVLVLACVAVARFPAAVLVLGLAAAVPAVIWSDGWVTRTQATTSTSTATGGGLDTGRGTLIRQSLDVLRDHPLTGVGPGRYVTVLRDRHVDPAPTGGVLKPVHNLPLLAAAEGGVAAGIAMLLLFAAAGWTAWRAGPLGMAVFVAFLPFCFLDHFPYTFPQGEVMLGLWLAAIATAGRPRLSPQPNIAA